MIADCFSFKVKPEKGKPFYFTVRVFHSKRAMLAYYKSMPQPGKSSGFEAVTIPLIRYKNARVPTPSPDIGEILFHRPKTGTGIVSHEMTHAALHYLRIKKLSLSLDADDCKSEEPLALCIGNLTRQFMMKY